MNWKKLILESNQEVRLIFVYNLATLFAYHFGDLQPVYVLWAYFLQSLQIGARYWFLEVYQQFRAKHKQWFMAFFFVIHFGGFHAGYLVFLLILGAKADTDTAALFSALKFNALFLFIQYIIFIVQELTKYTPDHSRVFFFVPYARIIPMHIIIILGINVSGSGLGTFDVFVLLKIISDLFLNVVFDRK